MIRTISATLLGLAALAAPALAGLCQTENLMPEFFGFADSTRALAPEQRAERFVAQFANPHPEFYTADFGGPEKIRAASLRLLDPAQSEHIDGFPPLTEERFRAVAATLPGAFETAQKRYMDAFPDFNCGAGVAFAPSFLFFDGSDDKDAQGLRHMRFGVDAIALLHGPEDTQAFFAHEIFHIYHHELLGNAFPTDEQLVWWQMWEEGMATYVSKRLTPGLSEQQVFWFPVDIVERMKAPGTMKAAARLMLADFDKSGTASASWFQSNHSAPGLPPRAGYYVGYRMAAELGRKLSLQQLANMRPDEVKKQARAFLVEHSR